MSSLMIADFALIVFSSMVVFLSLQLKRANKRAAASHERSLALVGIIPIALTGNVEEVNRRLDLLKKKNP